MAKLRQVGDRFVVPNPSSLGVHVALPIAVGALIYVLWRVDTLLVFTWLDACGLHAGVRQARIACQTVALPDLVRFSLPDALWAYAFAFAIARIWAPTRSVGRWAWLGLCSIVTLGGELGQAVHLVVGTFDPADLALSAAGLILGWRAAISASRRFSMREAME